MRTETIICDCCKTILKPKEYFDVELCVRSCGKSGKMPENIKLNEVCSVCTWSIHKMLTDFINIQRAIK